MCCDCEGRARRLQVTLSRIHVLARRRWERVWRPERSRQGQRKYRRRNRPCRAPGSSSWMSSDTMRRSRWSRSDEWMTCQCCRGETDVAKSRDVPWSREGGRRRARTTEATSARFTELRPSAQRRTLTDVAARRGSHTGFRASGRSRVDPCSPVLALWCQGWNISRQK